MPNFLRTLLASLATGYVFFYFSELMFWARPRPEDSLPNWLATWLAYSLMAVLFLAVMQFFRARRLAALFLCGAFFGWLAEGVVVQTAYESLPLSLSFTGLAWHALVTVLAGWYGLQKVLRGGFAGAAAYAAGLGLFAGFWGVCWFYEEPGTTVTPALFALYQLAAAALLGLSLGVMPRIFIAPFAPSRWAVGGVAGFFLLVFLLIAIPAAPLAAVILPALLLVLFATLRRNRLQESPGDSLEFLSGSIPARNLLALLFLPLVAGLMYGLYYLAGLRLPTNWVVYLVTTPAGFILFGWSLWQVWRGGDRVYA